MSDDYQECATMLANCRVLSCGEALRLMLEQEFPAHTCTFEYAGEMRYIIRAPMDLDPSAVAEVAKMVLPVSIAVEVVSV